MAKTKRWRDGAIRVVGIHGEIRVASNHDELGYELIFYCEPINNELCDKCKFKFRCFADEEIQVIFRGQKIGIFPGEWKNAEPTPDELEKYLFGHKTGNVTLRVVPSSVDSIFNKWEGVPPQR